MKNIKNLTVTVTYAVSYEDIEVSDEVYEQLTNNSEFAEGYVENLEALDWLSENIKEQDAMAWKYEIDNID
jgi:RNAse (barnase) inhibitor barstar